MIVIKLQGGLGNQMFQYAFANILAKKNNSTVLLDNSFFNQVHKKLGLTPRAFELSIFNNLCKIATNREVSFFYYLSKIHKVKKKLGLNYHKIYIEPSFGFQSDVLSIKAPVYVKGYFQSYKYFIGYEDFVRQLFSFPVDTLKQMNKDLLIKIKSSNSIAIHIRRGDYVNDQITAEYHGSCSLDYYIKAIKLLASRNKDFTLVFFSDDCNWVEEQFKDLPYSNIFVHNNKGEDSWIDMFLMSSCSHTIIANSSFSWWAAWLNINPEKIVIAPKKWFKTKDLDTSTLLPEEWITI